MNTGTSGARSVKHKAPAAKTSPAATVKSCPKPISRNISRLPQDKDLVPNIIQFNADAVMIVDLNEIVRFVNQAAIRMFGRPESEIVSHPFGFPITAGRTVELMFSRADGMKGFAEMRVVPIEWDGHPVYLATLRDVTERKYIEEQLRGIYEKLRQKHEELQSFYHTVSHELKTPLTSAREFVSLVLEGLAGPLTDSQKQYLVIAQESCDQMRNCINDMLDTTRLDTGKMRLELKRGSLSSLLLKMVTTFTPAAEQKHIRLTSEVHPDLPEVLMDHSRIEQVISNLLNNAMKFTPEGGAIAVRAAPAPGEAKFIQVEVRDAGCGIPPEHLDRIFDRLYQVQTGTAASSKGLGLGLHICRELVQLHGGDIHVESSLGNGSAFFFTLPVEPSRLSVLLVDDAADTVELFRQILEAHNFSVAVALSGEEALARLNERIPDVVVVDLSMSGMDGVETIRQIRARWRRLPVIIHAAYSSGDLVSRTLEFSPVTLLAKPCPPEQFVDTVRNAAKPQSARQV
jgi:signal transduction histidine kinase/CheY-like chemotaxis protein